MTAMRDLAGLRHHPIREHDNGGRGHDCRLVRRWIFTIKLECLFFLGYDPYFDGSEPPGL